MAPILSRAAPFVLFVALLALSPLLHRLADMDGRWWYAVRVALATAVMAGFWRHYVELASIQAVQMHHWLLTAAVGVAVFALWVNLDFFPLAFPVATGYAPLSAQGGIDWGLAATRLLGSALVVPVMEELFWRSLVLRWIEHPRFLDVAPAQAGTRALLISALLFGLEHHLWFAGLLAGIAYGWLYMHTGNLWTAIAAHAITNTVLGAWVLLTGSWRFW
jgi:hypothetical protein